MPAALNHTIVAAHDAVASATFLARTLGLPPPSRFGPFVVVETANEVSLDYSVTNDEITPQHYAFIVTEGEFDEIFDRVVENGAYWADPGRRRANEINHNDGGRGVYFEDPNGHLLEIITRPYGSGAS